MYVIVYVIVSQPPYLSKCLCTILFQVFSYQSSAIQASLSDFCIKLRSIKFWPPPHSTMLIVVLCLNLLGLFFHINLFISHCAQSFVFATWVLIESVYMYLDILYVFVIMFLPIIVRFLEFQILNLVFRFPTKVFFGQCVCQLRSQGY